METSSQHRPSFGARLVLALRSKKSSKRLKKGPSSKVEIVRQKSKDIPVLNLRQVQLDAKNNGICETINKQTGERMDNTTLIHSLAHEGSFDSIDGVYKAQEEIRDPGEPIIASLTSELWGRIASYLSPLETASLAFSSKTLFGRLGRAPWILLSQPENMRHRIDFLVAMDSRLPNHLFCFPCATYHLRIQKGEERLKATNLQVVSPLFNCPNALDQVPPRTRLTPGHTLPFSFVQLAIRYQRDGPNHGVPVGSLCRRYKDPTNPIWSHQNTYYISKGHLLLRVVSQAFADPDLPLSSQRHLLYSREDYFPYFSVCAHWRDGKLMDLCKCALTHIPKPKENITSQLKQGPKIQRSLLNPNAIPTLCGECRPMRRCPECPTEYLIELKLGEDKTDPLRRFKQVLVVTRWSDLGDGTTPLSREWAACNGQGDGYDSFEAIGKRAISGVFEAQSGVTMPYQRILSLNPNREKQGEEGHKWY